MLKSVTIVIKEQIQYKNLILRMSHFETKGKYQIHYLGNLWQIISPLIQILIYWFVFGIGIRGGDPIMTSLGELPFFLWMLMGLIPWFFISPSIIQGSSSIHQKVSLVSKLNFPISILPTTKIVGNGKSFLIMMLILIIILMLYGIYPTFFWLQLIYYLGCLFVFLFALTILTSTIATLVRDVQMLLQSTIRMLLYLSPILWDPTGDRVPDWIGDVLKLNPFYYIIDGIRSSFLAERWFFEDLIYMGYFWALTFATLYFGTKIHIKFREKFVDYI